MLWKRTAPAGAPLGRRLVFRLVHAGFRRASGARSEAELQARIPVILVHGDRDSSASVKESRRLAQRLSDLRRPVELLVIPGAGHVFNFRDRRQAGLAWDATRAFLDRHLRSEERS